MLHRARDKVVGVIFVDLRAIAWRPGFIGGTLLERALRPCVMFRRDIW